MVQTLVTVLVGLLLLAAIIGAVFFFLVKGRRIPKVGLVWGAGILAVVLIGLAVRSWWPSGGGSVDSAVSSPAPATSVPPVSAPASSESVWTFSMGDADAFMEQGWWVAALVTLLLAIGIAIAAAVLAVKGKKWAAASKALWVIGTIGAVVILFPQAWVLMRDAVTFPAICPKATAKETRECLLNTKWSVVSAEKGEEGVLCYSPGGRKEEIAHGDFAYFHFRASEGKLLKKYRIFPEGTRCSTVKL